jgi:hypothetical protein
MLRRLIIRAEIDNVRYRTSVRCRRVRVANRKMRLTRVQSRPMRMTIRRRVNVAVTLLALACGTPAWAQKVTTVEGLTLSETLGQLTGPLGSRPVGEAIGLATALEIATAPLGTVSGNFLFKLDPATGLLVRKATTFGPAFTDRALTSGEGQVSIGVSFSSSTYDKLSGLSLDRMQLGSVNATSPKMARTGLAGLTLTSRTLVFSGMVGVTDNLDIGIALPMVRIALEGTSSLKDGEGTAVRLAAGSGVFAGLGDVAALAKYRLVKFGGVDELPDPGGVSVVVNMRLPTGDRENLRGLGVTRTLASLVASGGKGRIRPHANGGFEFWSKGVEVATSFTQNTTVTARHQIQYAAGVELEATPKLTFIVDFLGRHIQGAGKVGFVTDTLSPNSLGVTSTESLVALPDGIQKLMLVPGLKLNLKGKLLLTLNALMTLKNNGLHATVTPVVGIDLTL